MSLSLSQRALLGCRDSNRMGNVVVKELMNLFPEAVLELVSG